MERILCSKILGKTVLGSACEFNFALAIAKSASCFDMYLDMSNMKVDQNIIKACGVDKFRYYIQEGYIYMGDGVKPTSRVEEPDSEIDVSFYNDVELYKVEDGKAEWSFKWAENNYGSNAYKFTVYKKRGFLVLSVVAYYAIKKYLGLEKALGLRLDFNSMETINIYYYLDVYGCTKTIKWLRDQVFINLDMREGKNIDLDYSLFCKDSAATKKYGSYTMSEKVNFIKEVGWKPGDVLVLWERSGMCVNNKYGNLKSSTLVILQEICKDSVGVVEVYVNKTKEEVWAEYHEMDEESKRLFSDILNKPPLVRSRSISLVSMGIDEYFGDEELILTALDPSEMVVKTISVDGQHATVDMSGVDAIYWLLCQYGIEFNKKLFKERYGTDKDFLWDMFGKE